MEKIVIQDYLNSDKLWNSCIEDFTRVDAYMYSKGKLVDHPVVLGDSNNTSIKDLLCETGYDFISHQPFQGPGGIIFFVLSASDKYSDISLVSYIVISFVSGGIQIIFISTFSDLLDFLRS